ncbi:MAG: hypothetical protein J6L70_00455 [Alphaproteobacteria bacterium]|nr:hypothetical protein [Alphaproteobacteria bacterium]
MKTFYIAGVLGLLFSVSGHAAKLCMAIDENVPTDYEYSSLNSSEWLVDISGTFVSGVAYCTKASGSVANNIYRSGTYDNKYCWCKMLSPAVSSWVFSSNLSDATNCAKYCSEDCATKMASSDFRSTMFSTLSDSNNLM